MYRRVLLAILVSFAAGSARSDKMMPDPNPPSAVEAPLARLPAGTVARPVGYRDLAGWREDDHASAFEALLGTCGPILDGAAALRDALPPPEALRSACRLARDLRKIGPVNNPAARAFFETHFAAYEIVPPAGQGFLTAYFEPEIAAARVRSPEFSVPVLARPDDLVTFRQGEPHPDSGLDPALQAARQSEAGLVPYFDRAAIWAGALKDKNLEIAWLRDHAELFITQVQGSARLAFTDGTRSRLVYSGRNGHPYTSIGKRLVETGEMALEGMTLAKLMGWLRANPARGRALMEENRSYIFFARDDAAPPDRGPIGGAGVPLTEGRSLAIDRTIWPYGLPIFIEVEPLVPHGGRTRISRLMIAQDTGSAITGPARGDFFTGSGADAGERAGLFRDLMRFTVLLPKPPR